MRNVLISKKMALDVIMQRSSTFCRDKTMLKISRTLHLDLVVKLQQNSTNRSGHCSPCVSICRHLTLVARNERTPAQFVSRGAFHTAISPGSDSPLLLSTRWGRFTSEDDARRQVAELSAEERFHLEKAIEEMKRHKEEKMERESEPPSWNQLKLCKMA